ncbi:unnamed protein product [Bemisia tabaci]|uniref:Uncharacterized protein n=1 Tax=Bemisia tabaci TaxID=7038 RepID=A0A9P0EW74_BEMTA|nr:unnamed protein product [Bemisia tabaci]
MSVRPLTKLICSRVCFSQQANKAVCSTEHAKELKNTPREDNRTGGHDMVGEPNPLTNLRPLKFHIPENETEIERRYRLKREEVQQWNDRFWARHNTRFFEEKEKYVESMKQSKAKDSKESNQNVTADEMSSFYAQFLNDNWNRHLLYNFEWYKKNISLVILSLQVKWSHLKDRIFSRRRKSV